MRRHKDPELKRSQQSVFYYTDSESAQDPVLRSLPNYFSQMHPHMLIEDASLSVMPVGGSSKDKSFRVSLVPANQDLEKMIASAISRREYDRDLAQATWHFFEQCVMTVLAFEEAVYEIVLLSEVVNGKPVDFDLIRIAPKTVMRRGDKLVQYVPAAVARKRNVPQFVELSPERILIFKPPPLSEGRISQIMESLSVLSQKLMPEFAFAHIEKNKPKVPFDVSAHIWADKLAIAHAGRVIGWNARGTFREEVLEYYSLHRQLLFEKFLIELREAILMTLNSGLSYAGASIGFTAQIQVDGLPTLADIEKAQMHLANGDLPFQKLMEKF